MKHCNKCGKTNLDSVGFCVQCGEPLPLAPKSTCHICGTVLKGGKCPKCTEEKESRSLTYTIFSVIGTLTAMLIVGYSSMEKTKLLGQYNWHGGQKYRTFVPSNILMVMSIMLFASTATQFVLLFKSSDKDSKAKHGILMIIQIIAGLFLLGYFSGEIDIFFLPKF